MRLINADELKELYSGDGAYTASHFRTSIDEMPTASPWHRVEEPPDTDEYVLAFDGDIVVMASFDGEKWWQHDTYESFIISPSHWMPLPEPPMEEA